MPRKSKAHIHRDKILELIKQGKTNPEIAKELNLSGPTIYMYTRKTLGGNSNFKKRIAKHKHLYEQILKLRLKLTDNEIRAKLNLTKSEMKSCMTYAYKQPHLRHLRKDTRRRDAWSAEEYRYLFRRIGIIPREQIAHDLKRGKSEVVIKDKLALLGITSKGINGLTISQFRVIFNCEPEFYIQTIAGPSGQKITNFKIVPWLHIENQIKRGIISCSYEFKLYVEIMAMFQKWVHGKNYWKSLLG